MLFDPPFELPIDMEIARHKQGLEYDVIEYGRYPSGMRMGGTYHHAESMVEAKKIIRLRRNKKRKDYRPRDYEVREHIWPWDSLLTRIKKTLHGVVYYESDYDDYAVRRRNKIDEMKVRMK